MGEHTGMPKGGRLVRPECGQVPIDGGTLDWHGYVGFEIGKNLS